VGCRGIEDIKDVYRGLIKVQMDCNEDFWDESTEEMSGGNACLMRRSAPMLGCVLKEHFNLPTEAINTTREIPKSGFNQSRIAMDFVNIFEQGGEVQHMSVEDMERLAGWTHAAKQLTAEEQRLRQDERNAAYAKIDAAEEVMVNAAVAAIGGAPVCNGSPDPWAEEHDVHKYRCCRKTCAATDSRTPCAGEANGESCWKVWHNIKSARISCQCHSGTCWDGTKCAVDGFNDQRKMNVANETANAERRIHARQVAKSISDYEKELWEASVVKKKEKHWMLFHKEVDARPSPIDKKWACSF